MTDHSKRAGAALDDGARPVAAADEDLTGRPAERAPGEGTPGAKQTSKEWQKLQSQFDAVFGRDA
jgi:hypothetical protein